MIYARYTAAVRLVRLVCLLAALSGASPVVAETINLSTHDAAFGASRQRSVVNALIAALNQRYVFPDVAGRVETALRSDLSKGVFDTPRTGAQIAELLTNRLDGVAHDKHLHVEYSDRTIPLDVVSASDDEAADLARMQRRNFGIARVERLANNIGYIDIRAFEPARYADDSIAAVMRLIAHTDALIIDLRKNGGGRPDGVALFESYLLDERTHLNDLFWRKGARTESFWTADALSGPRYGQSRDVYLLTSRYTFSGAEEMAYTLKQLGRATLVGETTAGGANPGGDVSLDDHFSAFIPLGRAINPITHENWEGAGVAPDFATSADQALATAQILALKKMATKEVEADRIKEIQAAIVGLEHTR